MNVVKVTVESTAETLAGFGAGALVHVQSGAASGGPFSDIASPTQTIVAGTTIYTFYDAPGTASTWYQTRFENVGATVTSAWSAAFQVGLGAGQYCDIDQVKLRLWSGDPSAPQDALDDALISDLIGQTSDWIEQRTGRRLYQSPGTFLFDGYDVRDGGMVTENGKCLLVPRGIVSLSLVEVATYTGAAFNTIPSSDWFLRPTTQERETGWPATELWITNIPTPGDTTPAFYPGFGTIRLTGILGFTAVPPSVVALAERLVISTYRALSAGGGNQVTIAPDGTRTIERAMSPQDWQILEAFSFGLMTVV